MRLIYRQHLKIMKLVVLLLGLSAIASATVAQEDVAKPKTSDSKTTTIGFSIGFADINRISPLFSLPKGWDVSQTTGFRPVTVKAERTVGARGAVAARFFYDGFNSTLRQTYPGIDNYRYRTNSIHIFGVGVSYIYYPNFTIPSTRLRPYLEAGVSLCNIRQTAVPIADSAVLQTRHDGYLLLKAGASYQIMPDGGAAAFFDVGYDRAAICGLGFSCALHKKKK